MKVVARFIASRICARSGDAARGDTIASDSTTTISKTSELRSRLNIRHLSEQTELTAARIIFHARVAVKDHRRPPLQVEGGPRRQAGSVGIAAPGKVQQGRAHGVGELLL